MELIKLLGVLIVIVGFALKLDSILIIFLALIATGIVGGLGVGGLLETIGTNFVANRSMAIFIMILLVTGTLERNGLREAAANLIRKVKSATAGKLVAVYGMLNALFGAFNVSFGGVAGFIRPVLLPMIEGAISNKEGKANEDHVERTCCCYAELHMVLLPGTVRRWCRRNPCTDNTCRSWIRSRTDRPCSS